MSRDGQLLPQQRDQGPRMTIERALVLVILLVVVIWLVRTLL